MSLESNIAALVAASTKLTQAVNITKATVEATRDSTIAKEAPVTTAKDAVLASTAAATTDATTTGTKLAAVAADYAAQKTTKGLAAVQTSADTELKDRLHRRDPARHPFRGARPSLVMDFVRRECHRNNAAGNLEPVDLGSFMTFTRGSTATYVGPDGLIKTAGVNEARYGYDPVTGEALGLLVEEQRTNLIPGDQINTWGANGINNSSANGTFTRSSTLITPAGDLSAYKLCKTPGTFTEFYVRKNTGVLAAGSYCLSICVHETSDSVITLRPVHLSCAAPTSRVNFNPVSKTFSSQAGYADITKCGYAVLSGGWVRVWLVFTTPSSSSVSAGIDLYTADGVGDGVSGAFLWGAQLEAGAFPTSYIPTPATFTGRASTKTYFDSNGVMQTAASGVAVTDYGYVDGRWISKGLSLEGQATNLLTYSGTLTDASWGKPNAISVSGNTLSFVDALSRVVKSVTTADGIYTLSARFSLADVGKKIKLAVWHAGKDGFSYADSTIPESGVVTTTVNATGITNVGIINSSAGTAQSVTLYPGTGIQFEAGPVATSYIPTTAAQVTRAADTSTSAQVTRAEDDAKLNSITTWYNQDCGASVLGYRRIAPYISGLYPGGITFGGDMASYFTSSAIGARGRGVTRVTNVTSAEVNTNGLNTIQTNRDEIVLGAVNGIQRTSLKKTVVVTSITLGKVDQYLNGYIRQLTYFPRQLSDADLQALTILED